MKQQAHGPHRSPEKQFHKKNTLTQSYDYITTLIMRGKKSLSPLSELNGPFYAFKPLQGKLCAKFG